MEVSSRIGVAIDPGSATKRASDLAAKQFGAISRPQLLQVGFTPTRVRGWVRGGRLHRKYPGVYAYGRPVLGTEGKLAATLLYAGPGSALGGISVLWWMQLLERRPHPTQVDAPGRRSSLAGIRIRHPREVRRSWHRGLPVVALPDALLAATGDLSHDSLRLVLARAEFHHLLDLSEVHAALGRGRPGSAALRAALGAHLPQLARCESPLEIDFVLLCERFRVPLPEPNERIGRWRPDMLWREARLVVELDGEDAHHTPAQLLADERRAADLRTRGFTVDRYGWDQIHHRAAAVAAALRARLMVGASSLPAGDLER